MMIYYAEVRKDGSKWGGYCSSTEIKMTNIDDIYVCIKNKDLTDR